MPALPLKADIALAVLLVRLGGINGHEQMQQTASYSITSSAMAPVKAALTCYSCGMEWN
jgi:hypothetical protein